MIYIRLIINWIWDLFSYQFYIFGFPVSFWQMFVLGCLGAIAGYLIHGILKG